MAAPLDTSVDISPLFRSADRFAVEMGKGYNDSFLQSLRGMVRRAAGITPPASRAAAAANAGGDAQRVGLSRQDQERGFLAMEGDVRRIFKGYGLSANRRARLAGVSDIERIHARLFATKTPGRKLRSDRPGGDPYIVDEDALQLFLRGKRRTIGWTAGGWNRGAAKLGFSLPAWVKNKPAPGSATVSVGGLQLRAHITNDAVHPKLVNETNRRLTTAVRYQVAANERAIKGRAERIARQTGLSA